MIFYARKSQKEGKAKDSVAGDRTINVHHIESHICLYNDYFSENWVFDEGIFSRRHRTIGQFLKIRESLTEKDNNYLQKLDAAIYSKEAKQLHVRKFMVVQQCWVTMSNCSKNPSFGANRHASVFSTTTLIPFAYWCFLFIFS